MSGRRAESLSRRMLRARSRAWTSARGETVANIAGDWWCQQRLADQSNVSDARRFQGMSDSKRASRQ